MAELQDVLRAVESARARGEAMALATVVGVHGSAYRRVGARLVVTASGTLVGTISGGCLETEVRTAADEVMAEGRPRLLRFDLTADDEAVWGWGLGCNGIIDVLVEPGDLAAQTAGAVRRTLEERRSLVVVTIVEAVAGGPAAGARLAIDEDGRVEGTLGDEDLDREAREVALIAVADDRPGLVHLPTGERAFVDVLRAPIRLLVCGAGPDAAPLVRFAAGLGWRVEVFDDREPMLVPERFPGAARLVHADPIEAATAARVDQDTYAVVVSHNFIRDRDYLRSFLGSSAPYIGMLGPSGRLERLLDDLRRRGAEPSPDDLARVHGPAGLDVGAEGPEEVAWSIIAEVLAVRNGRSGGFLRERSGPIHGDQAAGTSRATGVP
jgi:xanthine/CO dehydrogenase XdhC/CoxF family maturation factor